MITQRTIQTFSDKLKIDAFSIFREYIQLVFLSRFYTHKESEKIYFKGGTLVHFLLGSFRFSEDLDFTVTMKEEALHKLLQKTMEEVKWEIPSLSFQIINSAFDFSLSYRLKYTGEEFKFPLTIKLEFSLREKPLTTEVTVLQTEFPVSSYPLVVHLGWEEVLAEKIRALLTRGQGRDLFDTWFLFSKGVNIRLNYINEKMKWYKKKVTIKDIENNINDFDEKELKKDLGKFLPRDQRKIITHLKKTTLKYLSTLSSG